MFWQVFGKIDLPGPLTGYGEYKPGLINFFNNLLKLITLVAGLFTVINFIMAGYGIMSSQGDPEKISKAQSKIWNSVIGMVIIVASFSFAALLGWLLFKNTYTILKPKIYGPGL